MIVWSVVVGSSVTGSGVVQSYGPIERTYPMPLKPLRLKVTHGSQQDIPYFNKIAVSVQLYTNVSFIKNCI